MFGLRSQAGGRRRRPEAAAQQASLTWCLARSSQAIGSVNTLPLELQGLTTTVTKPDIYALGTLTSAVSFLVIFSALIVILVLQARQRRHGSDAGKGMV